MKWVDVFGAPGVGKSTICNPVWSPSVPWDGGHYPKAWWQFLSIASALAYGIEADRGAHDWRRMFEKAARKMATLYRRQSSDVYFGVGFAQRGIDLAWRLRRWQDAARYFELMPVSAGVCVMCADVATIQARNRERGKTKPSRELSRLVPVMVEPIEMAVSIMRARAAPVLELNTLESPNENRKRIVEFANVLASAA